MCVSKISLATGTRPGCATHVPSCPARTSRNLSCRTFSRRAPRGPFAPAAPFPHLILPPLLQRLLVRRRIVLDRNLRRHPTHGMYTAAMAGLDQQVDVRAEKAWVRGLRD